MKNPLHYQISEYDCGPTSMLNAIIYLFDRDEIPPEVIRNTMLYCLDCYSKEGIPGKRGTSRAAIPENYFPNSRYLRALILKSTEISIIRFL